MSSIRRAPSAPGWSAWRCRCASSADTSAWEVKRVRATEIRELTARAGSLVHRAVRSPLETSSHSATVRSEERRVGKECRDRWEQNYLRIGYVENDDMEDKRESEVNRQDSC